MHVGGARRLLRRLPLPGPAGGEEVLPGHGLLETFIGVSRSLGYKKCSLLVSHFNPRAKNLYQSLGFQKVGYVPDCILPGIHENIMVKDL